MLQMRVPSRHFRTLGCTAALTCAAVALPSAVQVAAQNPTAHSADRAAQAKAATRPARSKPVARRDVAAARLVHRSGWEPRRRNRKANHRRPSKRAIHHFRRWSDLPRRYRKRVTGHYRGTTDEILQWAAYKWGFSPDVFRAVGTVESWWKMSAVGDDGHSFGIMQVKRGKHCCFPLSRRSTAFNADYYGAWLRSVYDGRVRWLNREVRGRRYSRGDLWGSVGVWFSGRWHYDNGHYVRRVKQTLRKHVWRRHGFRHSG
jgi:hypothetical protein